MAQRVTDACRLLSQAADRLKLDWDSAMFIMARAVKRGLEQRNTEEVTHIGIDEKSFGRGQDYVSLMTDLKNRRAQEVVPGRSTTDAVALQKPRPRTTENGARVHHDGHGRRFRRRHQAGLPAGGHRARPHPTGDGLGVLLGIDRSSAFKILKNRRSLTEEHVKKLATRFKVAADVLLAWSPRLRSGTDARSCLTAAMTSG